MSRWTKRPEEKPMSIEQFELKFDERVVAERKKLEDRKARGLPPEAVVPRKLSPAETDYLKQLAERVRLAEELAESGW